MLKLEFLLMVMVRVEISVNKYNVRFTLGSRGLLVRFTWIACITCLPGQDF